MMNKRAGIKWVVGICALGVLMLVGIHNIRPSEKMGFVMDTSARLVIYDRGDHQELLEGAFALLREIDDRMNVHREDSELSRLNREKELAVSPQLYQVIERGLYFSRLTNGCFDITVRPLTQLWDFKRQQVPGEEEVSKALQRVNYRNVSLKEGCLVQLHNGASLDLGGIAKGYAADCVAAYLKENGVKKALIDIGGNIRAVGTEKDSFRIGLQDPKGQQGTFFATLDIGEESVVSSGVYERNFTNNGRFYHHIIDPRTGRPLDNGIIASSVVTESGMDADALSTAVMVMGAGKAISLIDSLPGVECVLVDQDHRLYSTEGLQNRFQITLDTYQIAE